MELKEFIQEQCETADVTVERVDQDDEQIVNCIEITTQPENHPQDMTMHNLSNIL